MSIKEEENGSEKAKEGEKEEDCLAATHTSNEEVGAGSGWITCVHVL